MFPSSACCCFPSYKQHFRNFHTELKRAVGLGFEELNPNRTADELFGHLQPGDKVAITTRFNNAVTKLYVQQLERRGLKVRTITGQSAVQDFCFLIKAEKELVGNLVSTFTLWAAVLGNAKIARLYICNKNDKNIMRSGMIVNWTDTDITDTSGEGDGDTFGGASGGGSYQKARFKWEIYDTKTKPNKMPPK
jgi:hypothetical protein